MAKKKKPTLKPPAGVNRGFATTSVPKKVVESKPEKDAPRAGASQASKDSGPTSASAGNKDKDKSNVRTLYGFDEDDAEQQLLQDLVDKYWEKSDKETTKLWKTIEFDRRQAATFQRFDIDPEIREELLDLVSYCHRVPEAEDKHLTDEDDSSAQATHSDANNSSEPVIGSSQALSAHATEFIPGETPSPSEKQPLRSAPPDWDTLPPPPLKDAAQPLDKALPKALVVRGLLLKLGFTVDQADLALKHTSRLELDDCLTFLALRLPEEELEAATKQVGNNNQLGLALPSSSAPSGESASLAPVEDDEPVTDRSVPPSHPAYTFKRSITKLSSMRYVHPPPEPTTDSETATGAAAPTAVPAQESAGKKKREFQPPSNDTIIIPMFRVRELLKHAVNVANEAQALLADDDGEMDVVTAGAVKAWVATKMWTSKVEEVYNYLKRSLGQAHLLNPQGIGYETAQVVRRVHGLLFARTVEAEKVPRFNISAAESVLSAASGKQRAGDRPRAGKDNWQEIVAAGEEEAAQKKKEAEAQAQEAEAAAAAEEAAKAEAEAVAQAQEEATNPSPPLPPDDQSTQQPLENNGDPHLAPDKFGEEDAISAEAKGDEEEAGLGGLFEEPTEGTAEEDKDNNTSSVTVRQLPKQAKGGSGGNSPQSLLLQTLRRIDAKAMAKYETVNGPGRFFRSRLTVQWSGPHVVSAQATLPVSQRRAPDTVYLDTFALTGECTESKTQAHDLMATLALNCIEQDRPAQRMLGAGFREWWDEVENCRSRERSTVARLTLAHVRDLIQPRLIEPPPSAPAPTPSRPKQANEDDPVTAAQSLEAPKRQNERTTNRLREALEKRQTSPAYANMFETRRQLPIYAFRDHILDVLAQNQVFVLSGETGCGKSTQVPAYILEHCLGRGQPCKVYCTEPRRISAISLAERVSAELGESKNAVGTAESLVGYAIRLESSVGRDARLIYATNGIVLRMLEGDGFKDITHLIIDEVHERSIESDFLLIILKSLMAAKPELKVVLMSATVDAERISAYFGGCPTLAVPGRTFPVQVEHLEDAVELCKYVVEPNSPYERKQRRKNGQTAPLQSNLANLKSIEDEDEAGDDDDDTDDAAELAASGGDKAYSRQTIETIDKMDHNVINHDLIVKLLEKVCFDSPEYEPYSKAILCFMPGLADIRALHDVLTAHPRFNHQGFRIFPLHSSLSSDSQQHVFEVPPEGVRKIVISTNIAETGVTIPDVTCVIDSGRHREMRFDEKRQISRLVDCFIAKSNAKQRRGRAGRVQEGLCFHLFTKLRYDNHMADHPLPEMLRLSLQDLALKLKVMKIKIGTSIENALSQALDPPTSVNIQRAVAALVEVKALTTTEEITPLGRHLSKLPLDVHMGKFLLVATTMRCLDAALTITAALNAKSPFITPFGKESRADAAKQGFNIADSDLLTVANAFNSWKRSMGNHFGRQFCQKNFLSYQNLSEMEELRQQYLLYLIDAGFVQVSPSVRKDISRLRVRGWGKTRFTPVPEEYSQHGSSSSIIHAAAAAGLYPKVIAIEPKVFTLRTIGNNQPIAIHPSSVNFRRKMSELPNTVHQMLYFNLLRSRRLYACETAPLDDRALLLMCGESECKMGSLTLSLDKKVRVHLSDLRSLVLLLSIREQLQRLIRSSFRNPGQAWTERQRWFFDMAIKMLGADLPSDAQLRAA